MKKIITTFSVIIFSLVSFSQEIDETNVFTNKKGQSVLPEAGDFAIGIDASPFINLVGNIVRINDFTGPFNDPSAFNFVDGVSLYGKYFLSNNTAVRAKLNINSMSRTYNNFVFDDASTTDPDARVTDTWKHAENQIGLGLGYEMRKGIRRLQAFYGGELNLNLGGGSKDEYTYGNTLGSTDSIPTTTVNWSTYFSTPVDSRTLSVKNAGGFGFGLRGFVGIEYFIFPKISLGGEFGWGFSYNSVGEGEINTESWNYTDHARDTNLTEIAGSKSFILGNDNMGGNIFMLFHF
jgi:hypothetical protein